MTAPVRASAPMVAAASVEAAAPVVAAASVVAAAPAEAATPAKAAASVAATAPAEAIAPEVATARVMAAPPVWRSRLGGAMLVWVLAVVGALLSGCATQEFSMRSLPPESPAAENANAVRAAEAFEAAAKQAAAGHSPTPAGESISASTQRDAAPARGNTTTPSPPGAKSGAAVPASPSPGAAAPTSPSPVGGISEGALPAQAGPASPTPAVPTAPATPATPSTQTSPPASLETPAPPATPTTSAAGAVTPPTAEPSVAPGSNAVPADTNIPGEEPLVPLTDEDVPSMYTYDPWGRLNRFTYRLNARFDEAIFLPVANGYRRVPGPIRLGVHNFFSNLTEIDSFANYVLQARFSGSARSLGRFVINSTIGIGGLFDVARYMKLPGMQTGFSETLSTWGAHPGPYLVVPILGPSTLRDGVGYLGDYALDYAVNPFNIYRGYQSYGLSTLNAIDTRSNIGFRYYATGSPFEYEVIRFLYVRKRLIEDEALHGRGKPKPRDVHAPAGR
ncbi:MAG: VacJ family lipoprotein [Proteobacteria bacterium]|nr:VacJ family lipoprotein [Pseudomonadota bacterium]